MLCSLDWTFGTGLITEDCIDEYVKSSYAAPLSTMKLVRTERCRIISSSALAATAAAEAACRNSNDDAYISTPSKWTSPLQQDLRTGDQRKIGIQTRRKASNTAGRQLASLCIHVYLRFGREPTQ